MNELQNGALHEKNEYDIPKSGYQEDQCSVYRLSDG